MTQEIYFPNLVLKVPMTHTEQGQKPMQNILGVSQVKAKNAYKRSQLEQTELYIRQQTYFCNNDKRNQSN